MASHGRYVVQTGHVVKDSPTSCDTPSREAWRPIAEYRRKTEAQAAADAHPTEAVVSDKAANYDVVHRNGKPAAVRFRIGGR